MTNNSNDIDIHGSVTGGNVNIGGTQNFHGDVYINTPNPNASSIRAETTGSILISYSRHDREAVKQLYADLTALNFRLWRDLHDIEGGEPFWEEIKRAIDACESVVLCMSPDALKSEFVQKEWQYARQQGKRVIPVVVGEVDFKTVPRWMSRIDWKDFRAGQPERETVWASFIRTLNTPYTGRKVPFMADKLPDYYVNRPTEFENMVAALVNTNGAVAITAAVKGAGGFGKTTLALALCHDLRVRGAFDDGILWVTLGEKPSEADLLRHALDIVTLVTGERPSVEGQEAVKAELQKAINDRYMLLVLDDLWRKHDADLFLTDSPNSAVLITTRFDQQLPDSIKFRQNVDAMSDAEAVNLLTWGIDQDANQLQAELLALAKRLGRWAVILRLTNATLRKRIQRGDTLERAISHANRALDRQGLAAFDNVSEGQRADAVKATIEVSLELLDDTTQAQFSRLAVFPENADIPFQTLEKLWELDDFNTEQVAEALQDAALLAAYDLESHTIRLHDVIRHYLIDEHRADLSDWQAAFVNALGDLRTLSNEYEWRSIAYHLSEAGWATTLRELLLDYAYLQAKLAATDPKALIGDCEYLPADRPVQLVKSAIGLCAHIVQKESQQFASYLGKHLSYHFDKQPELSALFDKTKQSALTPILPTFPDSKPAGGALIRTLAGHKGYVFSVVLAGEYAVSASEDKTLKVWNWHTGELVRTLEGHWDSVFSVALAGEYAVSASPYTLKVWNWHTGELVRTLAGHKGYVFSVALAGEYAVSASGDRMLMVWNWYTGVLVRTLEGHTGSVRSVALAGEYAVSTSEDKTLKVWNWHTGELVRTLAGHAGSVRSVALAGEYAVSASGDRTLVVWNWHSGALLHTLAGHTGSVFSVVLAGEYAVSASSDKTLKVWKLPSPVGGARGHSTLGREGEGELVRTFEGHTGSVRSVALAGEYAVSASSDKTLKVWNWHSGELVRTLAGHAGSVFSVALAGEYAVSASVDDTLVVWNWHSGELVRTLAGHTGYVRSVVLAGEYAVSASEDKTLKVWNWHTGELVRTLAGHMGSVFSVVLAGEYAVSASVDDTLVVWNWHSGELVRTLAGHKAAVFSVALAGEYAVSASGDRTLVVWNWHTGALVRTMVGHTGYVNYVALAGEYAVSASGDRTLVVWNWHTGEFITTFYADAPLYCVTMTEDASIIVVGDWDGNVHFLRPNAALRQLLGVGR